jgi:hypothetical protein
LLLAIISADTTSTLVSAVLDPSGANLSLASVVTQDNAGVGRVSVLGLLNPPTGTFNIQATVGSATTGLAAATYKGTNTASLAAACPTTAHGSSSGNVASWGVTTLGPDNVTLTAGQMGLVADICFVGSSSSVTWSTNTHSNSGQRCGYYTFSSTDHLTMTPDVAEQCAGVSVVISP